jgi:chromosome segregation ATPase
MESRRTDEGMNDLSRQIDELREEMRGGFKDVRSEFKDVRSEFKDVRSEIKDLRSDVRSEMKEVRTDVRTEIKDVRTELWEMRGTMEARFDSVQRSMLWMMGTMLVVVASILASGRL